MELMFLTLQGINKTHYTETTCTHTHTYGCSYHAHILLHLPVQTSPWSDELQTTPCSKPSCSPSPAPCPQPETDGVGAQYQCCALCTRVRMHAYVCACARGWFQSQGFQKMVVLTWSDQTFSLGCPAAASLPWSWPLLNSTWSHNDILRWSCDCHVTNHCSVHVLCLGKVRIAAANQIKLTNQPCITEIWLTCRKLFQACSFPDINMHPCPCPHPKQSAQQQK